MYKFKNLKNVSFEELSNVHNEAFSDYIVPMHTTPEKIKEYFNTAGVDYSQSFGAFYEDKLIGLLVNSIDTLKGKTVAYDALTGIIKEHRKKGLFSKLFEHTKTSLKNNNIHKYYLEVITTNKNAYNIYKSKGGKIKREFSFLTGKISEDFINNEKVNISPLLNFTKKDLSNYEPSFANRMVALNRDIESYKVVHIEKQNRNVSAIFNKHGRIFQVKFDKTEDIDLLCAVFTYLSEKFENLQISNIPTTENKLIKSLLNIGFKNTVNQYEMCIEL